jgi:flagellar hook assembly protein FlgD
MSQVKIINNMNQKIDLLIKNVATQTLKGESLLARHVKIIDSAQVTSQLKSLANKKLITLIEMDS